MTAPERDGRGRRLTRIQRERRERILRAAEEVFATSGFAGAAMATIARKAGLPKANLHYYFGTKTELYRAVLDDILRVWLAPLEEIRPGADTREALTAYVQAKMKATRERPHASRTFAAEVMHGAAHLGRYLGEDLRARVTEKAAVLQGWIDEGRMAKLDPVNFFFMVWAVTQTYADFETQVLAVLGRRSLSAQEFAEITAEVTGFVLRGAGIEPPAPRRRPGSRRGEPAQAIIS
jgi:TetR/AcrR family transcriptional regulator